MRVGFDFDRVLFQTDRFKKHLFQRFNDFRETYSEAVVEGKYDPERHAHIMEVEVEEIYDELEKASEFLYDDVEKLQGFKEEFDMVIVSRGDPVFQKKKIKQSGALEIITDYRLVQEKSKDEVAEIDFLVDDSREELERIDIPGFRFDRDKHSIKDAVEKVRNTDEA